MKIYKFCTEIAVNNMIIVTEMAITLGLKFD